MKKRKMLAVMLIAALTTSMCVGCKTEEKSGEKNKEVEVQKEEKQEQTSIEQITIGTTSMIEKAVREEYNYDMLASGTAEIPLVYQDTEGQYHPLMASWETEDSLTWTYTIEDGMKWSDGQEVTAEDILYTLQYGDEHGSANFTDQTDSEGKTTTAKYSSYTLSEDKQSISLTLAKPNVRELSNMTSFRVMPKHIYDGKESVTEDEMRVGCGPYKFQEFNKEAGTITFTQDENYPQKPHVEKIVYKMFGNEDTMYMALQNGDIDMVWNYSQGVTASYQSVLAEDERITLENVPAGNAPAVLAFNNANGPFADKNLRQAVSYALNYDDFREYFGSPYSEIPNRGFIPAGTVGYKETEKLEQNLDKAAKCMEAAGYKEKNADGFYVDEQGEAAGFQLTVNAGKEAHVGYAELIKTNLEEFGIQVTLDTLDADSYNAKTSNKFSENNITMEAAIFGYTAAGVGMMNGMATIYVDGTHPVQGGCQVYDEQFKTILSEMSETKVMEDYEKAAGKMQDFYAEEVPFLALYWDNMMYAYSSDYENITVDYTFGLNNANTWFTITEKRK